MGSGSALRTCVSATAVLAVAAGGMHPAGAAKLYWAETFDDRVSRAETDGTAIEPVLIWPQLDDPVAIALDTVADKIYWAQLFRDRIARADLSGDNMEILLEWPQLDDSVDLALDLPGAKMYWAEGAGTSSRIQRADLDGSNAEVVLAWPAVSDPRAIAIDPTGGALYWAQGAGADSELHTANLDGTEAQLVLAWPTVDEAVALTIDPAAGQMYWAQTFEDRIMRAGLDGSNVETLFQWPQADDVVAITLDAGKGLIYWAQSFGDRIIRGDFAGARETVLEWPDLDDPVGLALDLTAPQACPAPAVSAAGPRYLRITPAPGDDPVALQVAGDGFDAGVECVSLYVQEPQQACVGGFKHRAPCTADSDCPANGSCQTSALLGPTPVVHTPEEWGIVNVHAAELRPSTRYEVRTDCVTAGVEDRSIAVGAVTWLWGDVDHSAACVGGLNAGAPCNRNSDCPDGACKGVSFIDIGLAVSAFKSRYTETLTMETADLTGPGCTPNRNVDFIDIGFTVEAFKERAFNCTPPCQP